MANFSQAFGYQTYLVPILAANVDLATELAKEPLGLGGFIDEATIIAADAGVTTTGTGGTYAMTAGALLTLDGTDNPCLIKGLTDASLGDNTSDESVITYDEETRGYETPVATSQSATLSLSGVSDFLDTGYQMMRILKADSVAESMMAKLVRVGPAGSNETLFGFGRFMTFTEKNPAGTIVKWDCSFKFYGPAKLKLATAV